MDPSLRLSCEELLELPYFQEEGGLNYGREGERLGRRHDRGSRRRQAGVSATHRGLIVQENDPKPKEIVHTATATNVLKPVNATLHRLTRHYPNALFPSLFHSLGSVPPSVTKQ